MRSTRRGNVGSDAVEGSESYSHVNPKPPSSSRPIILAVASGGGHWIQLQRVRASFGEGNVTWVTTFTGYEKDLEPGEPLLIVQDASRWTPFRLLRQAMQIVRIVVRLRPDVVVTTGAAVGYFAVLLGKRLGARCVWIDSIANAEELSLSGRKAGKHVDLWLTQWPHLAEPRGPRYEGSVL